MEIEIGGNVVHTTADSGRITVGTPARGGELTFSFNPAEPFESQKIKAENGVRLLEYAKMLKETPENLPPVVLSSGGATAKVG